MELRDIRLISVNHGVNKEGNLYCQASFKLTRDDNKSVIVEHWLNGNVAEKAIRLGADDMPLVDITMAYSSYFKPTIVDIKLKSSDDETIDFE